MFHSKGLDAIHSNLVLTSTHFLLHHACFLLGFFCHPDAFCTFIVNLVLRGEWRTESKLSQYFLYLLFAVQRLSRIRYTKLATLFEVNGRNSHFRDSV